MIKYSNAIRSLWTGSCIILEESSVVDADNKRTVKHYIPIVEGVKCRVSYGQSPAASGNPAEAR
ncbi:hypothetical protein [Candidatus Methanomassiliicoccus intestinalis]|uniref:hypothetical protein n=1 Tax=Candidatus Methanomassiliicoccus intestinalis TaxID=1406512 RepID=UPI0037DD1101